MCVRSKERPRKCTDQAPFDGGDIQRDVFTRRARSRAAICNAANCIALATRSYMKENNALILPYKQSGVHWWRWRDRHFVWWNSRACTCVYRLSFCLRRSVKNINVVGSSSHSCQQNALIKILTKPLSNCRSRNSGHILLTFQTFRVRCGVCVFRRNVFQWLTKGHTKLR